MESLGYSCCSTTSSRNQETMGGGGVVSDEFPIGMRVLVVDDDSACLKILEQMLRKCLYHVTCCSQATLALSLLRQRKGCFDVVISDVHMPDMDGFKLLEHVGLEMDLPVIMMSADGRTSAVMKGIKHGACDYLIKPVRLEELKNIWQHVVRKKWNGSRDIEQSGSVDETDRHKRGGDDIDHASSATEGTDGTWKVHKKRKDAKEEEEEGDLDNDDPSSSKKPRVVWSVELHQQFVTAVNQLGLEKAVPKRILELMNVAGLTRENVASHLQKFRLYLKRLNGVAQQSGIPNGYYGPGESNAKIGSFSGVDIQAMAASGQIPPQTLAALHAEFFGRPTGSLALPAMDKSMLLQTPLQGSKCAPVEHGISFGQPIAKCQSYLSQQSPQPRPHVDDIPSGFGTWLPSNPSIVSSVGNQRSLNTQNNNMVRQIQPKQHQSVRPEPSHTINVQPSCLVSPSQSLSNLHAGIDYTYLPLQSHNVSVGVGQVPDADLRTPGILDGYCIPGSISSSMSSCSGQGDNVLSWQSTMNSSAATKLQGPNTWDVHGAYTSKTCDLLNHIPGGNLGFVGKDTSLPSRFAMNDYELLTGDLNSGKTYGANAGGGVKQEINLDITENAKVGIPVTQQFSPSDLMSILSK